MLLANALYGQQWSRARLTGTPGVYDTLIFTPRMAKDAKGNLYKSERGIHKYDRSGNLLWTKPVPGESRSIVTGAAKLFVEGGDTSGNTYLACYDTSGNFLWKKIFRDAHPYDFNIGNLVTDKYSNIYLSCHFFTPFIIDSDTFINREGYDILFLRFDENGTLTWSEQIRGNATEWYPHIGVDSLLNIYCTGTFKDSVYLENHAFRSDGACGYFSAQCGDIFLCKYNSAGMLLWATKAGQKERSDYVKMKVSGEGNIYLCGSYQDSGFFGNVILPPVDSAGGEEQVFLVKYNSSGACRWGIHSGVHNCTTGASELLIYPNGSIYVTGPVYFRPSGKSYAVFGRDTLQSDVPYRRWFVAEVHDLDISAVSELTSLKEETVFPNPSSGIFSISLQHSRPVKCRVYDVLGKMVLKDEYRNASVLTIDLSSQYKGIYFVEIITEGRRVVKKAVVN
jgi:hypothetical protein